MIIRIVKMTFQSDKTVDFIDLFYSVKEKISSFPGCTGVELLNDIQHSNVYFTYSKWKCEEDLENYRNSELFKSTWSKTKILFSEKADAWSLKNA